MNHRRSWERACSCHRGWKHGVPISSDYSRRSDFRVPVSPSSAGWCIPIRDSPLRDSPFYGPLTAFDGPLLAPRYAEDTIANEWTPANDGRQRQGRRGS